MRAGLTQEIETRERLPQDANGLVKLNFTGKEECYRVVSERYGPPERWHTAWGNFEYTYTTILSECTVIQAPPKEEIAAQESVAKAKEALKAAENALKCVKEKK